MKPQNRLRFLVSIGVVGAMIVLALGQLIGNLWFQKAAGMGNQESNRIRVMKSALKVQPSHSFYWFSVGRGFQRRSRENGLTLIERRRLLEKAEKYLERAISLEPTASLYHYHLGWVYAALTPYRPSARRRVHEAFRRTILLNPTHTEFRWEVANYYLHQYARSVKSDGTDGLETDVDWARKNFQGHFRGLLDVQAFYNLNRILDRCFAVTQTYDDLKGLIPDQPSYHLRLAEFLNRQGMWKEAKREFEIAISQDPGNLTAHHAYGSALFSHKDYEEALAVWKKGQVINPKHPKSYLDLSKAYWSLNQKDEAIAELERLVYLYPDQTTYRLTLAAWLEGAGISEKALKAYQDALEKDPDNAGIYAQMANYWTRQKDLSEAEAALRRAISLSPSALGYRDQLARLYFQQKRYSRAVQEWKDLLHQSPKSIGALKGIARSYEALEAWNRALHYYQQALAINPDDKSALQAIQRIQAHDNAASATSQ